MSNWMILVKKSEEDGSECTIEKYKQNMMAVEDKDLDSTGKNPVNQETPEKRQKTVIAPYKKSKKV